MSAGRPALEAWLNQRWYGRQPGWLWILWPLEWLFAAVVACRRALWQKRGYRPGGRAVPVLVVGNIVAGGAGKTPFVIALVQALQARGYTPGVLSRGHGRSAEEACLVQAQSRPEEVGDEPLLIHQDTGCAVAVARRRVEAAPLLEAQGCDLLIADDGLQHYPLPRDLEIGLIPGRRRHGNGHLLPLGPLREPVERLRSCDFLICIDGPADGADSTEEWAVSSRVGALRALHAQARRPLAELAGQPVLAVAAIAHPEPFFAALRAAGLQVETRRFADHHALSPEDLEDPLQRPLIMTAKDAVKCAFLGPREAYSLEYTLELPPALVDAVCARLPDPTHAHHQAHV